MLFVIDVGNTNMVLGVFNQGVLKHEWRIKTDRYKTEDEYGMLLQSLFEYSGITFKDVKGVIISSVVPPIMSSLERMSRDYFNLEAYVIGKQDYLSLLKINYPTPKEIGADRVVNAVAAIEEYPDEPLIIIDFGTATTYCFINENGEYCGGIITPGINISTEALNSKASKLPKIEIEAPDHVIGQSTVEAMQSGVYYGTIGMIDGLVNRMKREVNGSPRVIATGGLAKLIATDSVTIDEVRAHLTLKGLYIIYNRLTDK